MESIQNNSNTMSIDTDSWTQLKYQDEPQQGIDTDLQPLVDKVFPIFQDNLKAEPVTDDELHHLHQSLKKQKQLLYVYESFFVKTERIMQHIVVPQFWARFTSSSSSPNELSRASFVQFHNAVKELYEQFAFFRRQLKRLERVCPAKEVPYAKRKLPSEVFVFCNHLHTMLHSQLPDNFYEIVYPFYAIAFRVFIYSHLQEGEEYMEVAEANRCMACSMPNGGDCQCQAIADAFTSTNRYLSMMGILEEFSGYTLNQLILERIDAKVNETKENYATSHMEQLERWLNTVVMQWLTRIYNKGSLQINPEQTSLQRNIAKMQRKLLFYTYDKYANMIVDQFFQIIINFPLSQPAVDDLKLCLSKININRCFVSTIRNMLCERLLHTGVDTPDILTGYVAALKTLAHFDPSTVLLRSITKPIKEYLRGRSDTVRCVVTSFTGDGTSDLAEELAKGETVKPKPPSTDQLEDPDWRRWQPDPVNMAPAALKFISSNRRVDIISMVVDIYGSKEIFVNEYRNLLAERLLSQVELSIEKEVKQLELLKLRFGESLLHSCEVMLKDITESKRINAHIHSPEASVGELVVPHQVSALIVSSQFWPTFRKETMELPDSIKTMFEKYTKAYESYKVNRTLQWTPLNGKVTIELEHNGKTQEMQVTPAQAAIIIHFSEQPQWELDSLGQKMNMPPIVLRKRIVFWQSHGLIRETKENVFVLIDKGAESETVSDTIQPQPNDVCEEEEAESAMESASDQREEELQVFWSYIEAMLTNLDSLPLDRIHQMLKMFASQVDFTQDELKHILQRKVREHKLVYAGGVYQLPKS
ncbi:anaphase-promoting complex subunit 2 [Anopheles maculipalpis]|uniref:anaphase-promoting complex subunit 2 n=1 Tax=Anopheles maculipalpis TaxID=1496333 RepID=UPI0021595C38|nr:anaphase-promoting complex subunit 2 [Anopheles maculipalpis]